MEKLSLEDFLRMSDEDRDDRLNEDIWFGFDAELAYLKKTLNMPYEDVKAALDKYEIDDFSRKDYEDSKKNMVVVLDVIKKMSDVLRSHEELKELRLGKSIALAFRSLFSLTLVNPSVAIRSMIRAIESIQLAKTVKSMTIGQVDDETRTINGMGEELVRSFEEVDKVEGVCDGRDDG